jgi:hypothetical protein
MNITEILSKIDDGESYTAKEVSHMTGIPYSTILKNVKTNVIPSRVILGKRYILGEDIRKVLTT